jgi:DNA-binding IclR family transcriptional regulator
MRRGEDTTQRSSSVTGRVLRLLDAFTAARPTLTLSELSRRADLPLSTTHRLAGELTEWGALERDGGRYRIGLRLWEVAALSPRGLGLRETAMPYLEDLYEATHENVQLAVLDRTEVVYIERLSARGAVNVITRVGGRLPVHATGVGLVLLAHAGTAVQEAVLTAPLRRFTAKTICTTDALRRTLSEVRRHGYAVSDGQIELQALSVAAPVRGPAGSVDAALSVVVPADGPGARAFVPAVVAAARGISRALGAPALRRTDRAGIDVRPA